ncbi:hypothetical protein M0Q97_08205 [Candidatus Dojkabacteria bacterium]|jgi:hypothetical protein|nr:hypothetical protein [Candidatus Dojkabacteria bacterium]
MNKLLQDIIEYLKNTYNQDKEIIEKNDKILNYVIKYYTELQLIYDSCNDEKLKVLTPITEKQSALIDTIYSTSINLSTSGFMFLNKENILIDNINILTFHNLYANTIKFLYQKNIIKNQKNYNLDSYSYLVENIDFFKNNLTTDECKLLDIIINYKFGYLYKIESNISNIVASFSNVLMNKILELDNKENILYIDTDIIFIHKAFNVELIFNMIDNLYKISQESNKIVFFIVKKRYIIFDDINSVKIKGIRICPFYINKEIKDLAYDKYPNKDKMTFKEYLLPKNKEIFNYYINIEKLRFERKNKLIQLDKLKI